MTGHDKHNRNSASPLRRLIKAFGIGTEHGRECAKSDQRSRDNRRSEAGNVFFTLFGAVAIVGVLGAGIMSTMRGPLTTMVEVNRIEEAKSVIRLNSSLVLKNATQGDSADAPDPPFAADYCDDDDFTEAPMPAGGGISGGGTLPSNVGATMTDPWGTPYGYCAWNHGTDTSTCTNTLAGENSTTEVVIAIVSAGPDRNFTTICSDLYEGQPSGDDIANKVVYNDAATIAGGGTSGGLWSPVGTTAAGIGLDLQVTGTGTSEFAGGMNVTGATTFTGVSNFGNDLITTGSVITNSIESSSGETGSIDIDGTITGGANGTLDMNTAVDITGATSVGGTLNVNGAISNDDTTNTEVTINDALVVTGAVDFASTLNVDGSANFDGTITSNVDDIVNIDDALDVTGATTMNSLVTINADGDSAGTDAFVVNSSSTSDIMVLDEAGNLDIAGDLTVGDGIFLTGGTDGMMLVADATGQFKPVTMGTDVAITNAGVATIQNDAVTTVKILNENVTNAKLAADAVTTVKIVDLNITAEKIANGAITQNKINATGTADDRCLKGDGSTLVWGDCYTTGGGGDGVGSASYLGQLLSNTGSPAGGDGSDKTIFNVKSIALGSNDISDDGGANTDVELDLTGDVAALAYCDEDGANCFAAADVGKSDRIIDAPDAVQAEGTGDTYIDVDTTDNGQTNSIIFVNDGATNMTILPTGQVDMTTHATIGGNLAVDTSVLFVDSTTDDNVGIGTADPATWAALDITSTTKGLLIPRLTDGEATTLGGNSPPNGTLIFNTSLGDAATGLLQFWDGTDWVDVGGGGAETGGLWAADDAGGNYIEYDDTALGGMRVGRIAGQPAPAIDWTLDVANSVVYTDQNVGIGVSAMSNDGGANTNVVLDLAGDIAALEYCDTNGANCFTAAQVDTLVGGGASPTDRIEDTGNQDTYIDTDTTNDDTVNSIVFHTAGTEKMVILPNGNVGIGKSDPNDILTVLGGKIVIRETDDDLDAVHLGAGTTTGYLTLRNAGTDAVYVTSASSIDSYFNAGNVIFGGTIADASARVQIDSTSQGFLPPRMNETDRNGITSPATGLLIFSTTAGTFQFNAGTPGAPNWVDVGAGTASLWTDLGGGRLHYGDDDTVQVGIGTDNPLTALDVNGGIRVGSVSAPAPTYLALNSLSNVDSAPADGQCLTYSSGSGNWVAGDCDAAGNTAEWTDDGSGNIYNADDGSVGIGTNATPDASAKFEIASTTQGFLPPRLADPTTITNPATGLLAYNSTDDTYQYNAGTPGAPDWVSFSSTAGSAGSLQDSTTPTPDTTIQVDTAGDGTANTTVFTNNGAESMRITAGGNVGIATASPSSELDVEGTIRAGTSLRLGMIAGDAPTYTGQTLGSLSDVDLSTLNTNDVLSWDGTNWIAAAAAAGGGLWTDAAGDIYNTDGGSVGIGTSSPADELHVYDPIGKGKIVIEGVNSDQSLIDFITSGDGASHMDDGSGALGFQLFTYNSAHANTDNRGDFGISSNQGGWNTYLYMDSVTESIGIFNDDPDAALDVTGDIEYTGTITDVSDRRLKTDITPLSAQDMIARLAAVDTYTFRMKDDETGRIEYGVMAQELEEIFPELVKTADDEMGTKSVNYTGLIAPMIEATKALKSENDTLKAELSAVKEQQSFVLAKLETMQSDISGMKVHTGYGIEKGTAIAMLLLLLSLGGITGAFLVRKQTQVKNNP